MKELFLVQSTKKINILYICSAILLAITFIYFVFFRQTINNAKDGVLALKIYDNFNNLIATGSAVAVFDNNTIITNAHVITYGRKIEALTEDNQLISISGLLYYSQDEDIAILKTNQKLKPLRYSTSVKDGDDCIAIGSPLGIDEIKNTISKGTIGNISNEYITHSSPISPGNSGGALLNKGNYLIGINTASYVTGQNLNLAIPISKFKQKYNEHKNEKVKTLYEGSRISIGETGENYEKTVFLNNSIGNNIINLITKEAIQYHNDNSCYVQVTDNNNFGNDKLPAKEGLNLSVYCGNYERKNQYLEFFLIYVGEENLNDIVYSNYISWFQEVDRINVMVDQYNYSQLKYDITNNYAYGIWINGSRGKIVEDQIIKLIEKLPNM